MLIHYELIGTVQNANIRFEKEEKGWQLHDRRLVKIFLEFDA